MKIKLTVDEQDFGTICVCALRYSMGRMTYMPSLIRDFVRPLLPKLHTGTVQTMLKDCEWQAEFGTWGSETIDKPGWVQWKKDIEAELQRRKENDYAKSTVPRAHGDRRGRESGGEPSESR